MTLIARTQASVSDLPELQQKFGRRNRLRQIGGTALLALVYLAALTSPEATFGFDPLVFAVTLSMGLYLPFGVLDVYRGSELPAVAARAIGAALLALIVVLLLIDRPIVVQRLFTVFPAFTLFASVVMILRRKDLAKRNPNWQEERFIRGHKFQIALATMSVLVNEWAIFLGGDWLWIASRLVVHLLVPVVMIAVALALPPRT